MSPSSSGWAPNRGSTPPKARGGRSPPIRRRCSTRCSGTDRRWRPRARPDRRRRSDEHEDARGGASPLEFRRRDRPRRRRGVARARGGGGRDAGDPRLDDAGPRRPRDLPARPRRRGASADLLPPAHVARRPRRRGGGPRRRRRRLPRQTVRSGRTAGAGRRRPPHARRADARHPVERPAPDLQLLQARAIGRQLLDAGRELHHRTLERRVLARHLPHLLRQADGGDEMSVQAEPVRTRVRARAVLVALIALLPAAAAIVYMDSHERTLAAQRLESENLRLMRVAATQEAAVFDGARRLVQMIAAFPAIRGADVAHCSDVLRGVTDNQPDYYNVLVSRADGRLLCGARPVDALPPAVVRERSWFKRVMASRQTAVGTYEVNPATGEPTIAVAHPVLDR